jgi:hypothetical protein
MTRDQGDTGPYGASSAQNTTTDWLSDFKPVEAKLSGMVDYAKALNTIAMNLMSHQTRVIEQMGRLTTDAFQGGFPEVNYAATLHGQNMSEFNQYLQNLHDGIYHTASAAKTIADTYGDRDGFSAIDLNSVQFAFADPNAKRPSTLPSVIGKTFSDQEAQAAAKGKEDKKNRIWTPTGATINPDGGATMTYVDQFGETRTITTSFKDGRQIVTVVDPTGKTVSDSTTVSYPMGSSTTTTNTDQKGNVTTSTSSSYTVGDTYVTKVSSNGKVKNETDVTYDDYGGQTTTTYTYGDGGKRHEDTSITVGQDNYVDNGVPDSPADDAIDQIRQSMPTDPDAQDTKIMAPGEPGVDYSGSSDGTAA